MIALRTRLLPLLVGTALIVSACSSVPVQEMSDARQALQAAREAGAPERAPEVWAEARRLLREAEAALEAGEYERASELAESAREKAIAARRKSAPDG